MCKDFGPELEAGLGYPHGVLQVGEVEVVQREGVNCFESVGDGTIRFQKRLVAFRRAIEVIEVVVGGVVIVVVVCVARVLVFGGSEKRSSEKPMRYLSAVACFWRTGTANFFRHGELIETKFLARLNALNQESFPGLWCAT